MEKINTDYKQRNWKVYLESLPKLFKPVHPWRSSFNEVQGNVDYKQRTFPFEILLLSSSIQCIYRVSVYIL